MFLRAVAKFNATNVISNKINLTHNAYSDEYWSIRLEPFLDLQSVDRAWGWLYQGLSEMSKPFKNAIS